MKVISLPLFFQNNSVISIPQQYSRTKILIILP